MCKFSVRNSHKAILCTHLKCTPFTCEEYSALSNTNEDWFCSVCLATLFPFNHFEDDTDVFFALFGFNCEGNFHPELLIKQKVFNPFFDDPETSHLLMNSNLDSNPIFFTANSDLLSNCIYLTSSEFNKIPFPPAFHNI